MDIVEALDDPSTCLRLISSASPVFSGKIFRRPLCLVGIGWRHRGLWRQYSSQAAVAPFTEAALIVGSRGGKSRILGVDRCLLCLPSAISRHLAAGELATIAVLASNRSQARSIFRFVSGLLKAVPLFALISLMKTPKLSRWPIVLLSRLAPRLFALSRVYSFAAVLCDEIAFWRQDETSANPDVEILRALRPGMASIPGSVLLMASSPYAKRGELYAAFRRHFGKDDARVLVWKADTATMNPED